MLLSNGGNLASFLYMLQESFPTHYDRIVSTIRLAVPYLRDFDLAPDRVNPGQTQLRWRDQNPDYEFGPHQLSDGSLRAIALITALLQPEELLPSVIFIDEPELGLHPSAVGIIGKLIKAVSAKRQVVVATQSPRLLSECAPEDIVVVEREEDDRGYGESRFRRLGKEDLGQWLNDYDLGALYEMNVTGGGPR
jgi:predicted ATPase